MQRLPTLSRSERSMGCFSMVYFLVVAPLAMSSRNLRSNGSTPVAPVPPESNSQRAPAKCSCDFCSSGQRVNPTAVSKAKCVPALTVDVSMTCRFTPDVVINADEAGMPYVLFCLCHCQPLTNDNSAQCMQFNAKEFAEAAGNDNGNCDDPKLMTQAEEIKMTEEEALAAARQAALDSGLEATKEQAALKERTVAAASEAKKHYDELSVSYENARLLHKEALYHIGGTVKGNPAK